MQQHQVHMRMSDRTMKKIKSLSHEYGLPYVAVIKMLITEALKAREADCPEFLGGSDGKIA